MTPTRWIGSHRVDLEICGSTNDEAAALARAGARHGTVVTAETQRAGRGRLGRTWFSPPGANLYLSIVLRPPLAPRDVPALTLAVGVAVCDAVRAAGAAAAALKWPNDVVVGGRKLAGILTEMSTRAGRVEHVVVGIGVDINGQRGDLPPELADRATSIADERGAPVDRAAFTVDLLAELEPWIDRFVAGGVAAITAPWEARVARDLPLEVATPAGPVRGRALGLDVDGALRIIDAAGAIHRVVSGEV